MNSRAENDDWRYAATAATPINEDDEFGDGDVEDIDDSRTIFGSSINRICVFVIWCVLSFDYMTTFLASLPWWQMLDGDFALYGTLVIGLYGLLGAVGAPLGGIIADRFGNKLVICVSVCFVVLGSLLWFLSGVGYLAAYDDFIHSAANATGPLVGNATIPSSVLKDASHHLDTARGLIIGSRVLSGLGSGAGLCVALRHLVSSAPHGHQLKVMNQTRVAAIIARIMGPVISSVFLFVPSSVWGNAIFNFSTWPALVAACVEWVALIGFVVFFRSAETSDTWDWRLWRDPIIGSLWKDLATLLTIITLALTAMWVVFSQLIPICAFVYQNVDSLNNLWLVYLPMIIGAMAYSIIGAKIFERMNIQQAYQIILLLVFLVVGNTIIFPFSLHPSPWLFYVGAVLFFFGNSGVQTILRAAYAKIASSSAHLGVLLSLLWISNGLAQFIGSSISSSIVTPSISDSWLRQNNCSTDYHGNSNYNCSACTITLQQLSSAFHSGTELNLGCYYLDDYVALAAVALGFAIFCGAATVYFLPKVNLGQKNLESLEDITEESRLLNR